MTDRVSLTIQQQYYEELRGHLFPGDGREAVAFMTFSKHTGFGRFRGLTNHFYPVPHDLCGERTPNSVTWPTEFLEAVLNVAAEEGLSIVKVHSHPSGGKMFSELDDKADEELFPGVSAWVGHALPHMSAVMLPDGTMFGRTVDHRGNFGPVDLINVAGEDLHYWFRDELNDNVPGSAKRIAQAFGESTYNKLRRLRVGLVGCSGTGTHIGMGLNLNHIGELFAVDPDVIDDGNRNRIPTATADDVTSATLKVVNMQRSIERRGLGTKVTAFAEDISDAEVIRALGSCDLLIGCVDSASGRHYMNKISSAFLIPYIDLGVRINADGIGGVEGIFASAHFITPGGSSLLSRGVYTLEQVNAEDMRVTDPDEYRQQKEEGYVKGVNVERPAVACINGAIANLVLEDILARIHGYRAEDNSEFAVRRLVFCHSELTHESDDEFVCPMFNDILARGDKAPLLGLWYYGDAA